MPFNPLKILVGIPNNAPLRHYENDNVRRNFQRGEKVLYDVQSECAPITECSHPLWVFAILNLPKVFHIPAAGLARLDNPNTPLDEAMDILHAACEHYNSTRDEGANLRLQYTGGHCLVKATTNIPAGTELLRAYAATQWLVIPALWHRSRMSASCKNFTEKYLTLVDQGARQLTPEDAFYMKVARNQLEWI
ncbi:hypothetical protein HK104_003687 [Borealophlyctis nickersoniae]|nr:hypothetical protein HK104_003687 [Borealophlyctis nickersoniae]